MINGSLMFTLRLHHLLSAAAVYSEASSTVHKTGSGSGDINVLENAFVLYKYTTNK